MPAINSLSIQKQLKDTFKNLEINYNEADTILYIKDTKKYNTCALGVFPGDCGTLILQNVSNITQEMLKAVKECAHLCGYDTVICTYLQVNYNTKEATRPTEDNFRKERWIRAVDGYSNRKYTCKTNKKIVYILHLRNCKHKGY